MTDGESAPVIEPNRVGAFRIGFVSCMSIIVVAFAGLAMAGSDGAARKGAMCFLLTPFVLLLMARWVATATRKRGLFLRAVLAHIGALYAAVVLVGVVRSGDPGFSGHGGVVLLLIVMIPYCAIGGAVVGLVAALAGRFVARRER